MKKILCIFIIAMILFFGSTYPLKSEEAPIQKKESIFPQSEYEKNFIFPPIIGPLSFMGGTDYEKTNPGLGYSVRYADYITKLDIYVYDLQINPIPNDVNSKVVVSAFQAAANDIFAVAKRGDYSDLKYPPSRKMNLLGKDMLIGTFEYMQDETARYSILMFTVHKGKFFKVRLAINKEKDESYEADTLKILEEITEKILMEGKAKGSAW